MPLKKLFLEAFLDKCLYKENAFNKIPSTKRHVVVTLCKTRTLRIQKCDVIVIFQIGKAFFSRVGFSSLLVHSFCGARTSVVVVDQIG